MSEILVSNQPLAAQQVVTVTEMESTIATYHHRAMQYQHLRFVINIGKIGSVQLQHIVGICSTQPAQMNVEWHGTLPSLLLVIFTQFPLTHALWKWEPCLPRAQEGPTILGYHTGWTTPTWESF